MSLLYLNLFILVLLEIIKTYTEFRFTLKPLLMKKKKNDKYRSLRISLKWLKQIFFPSELEKGNSVWIPQADCAFLGKQQVL